MPISDRKEDRIWLNPTKSGNGVRIFVPQGNGEKDKLYVAPFSALQKFANGEISGLSLALVTQE